MKRWFVLIALLLFAPLAPAQTPEHVILCGGPALRKWENLRVSNEQHDRWWANFIRASTLRMAEIRRAYGKEAKLVWIVYRPGYVTRGKADGKPYTKWIQDNATKRNCELVWINSGPECIRAINARPSRSIATFDFFGHSNRHCFLLDYGNQIMAVSQAWLHENDLRRINRSVFSPKALCQSYGCHTGESMSSVWHKAIGIPLIGARGKTDYIPVGQGHLPVVMGKWVR